jgi:hypothetical protein
MAGRLSPAIGFPQPLAPTSSTSRQGGLAVQGFERDAGAASPLELAQQRGLTAGQRRTVVLLRQQADADLLAARAALRPSLTLGAEVTSAGPRLRHVFDHPAWQPVGLTFIRR